MDVAHDLAAGPTVAHHHAKRLINESHDVDFETALEHATIAQRECSQTYDHKEAVEAFAEDREPQFEGR
jgi:enoyl-CoA hydratase/carnithine racemase